MGLITTDRRQEPGVCRFYHVTKTSIVFSLRLYSSIIGQSTLRNAAQTSRGGNSLVSSCGLVLKEPFQVTKHWQRQHYIA